MTWDSFGVASRELATQIAKSGYEPDIILAIAR
ncbi:MAG: phosphoribosyltransferase, partial [Actinobacteria bacterium]|nr:phosphoribosyltransferase [Actinomycetota bacterium]